LKAKVRSRTALRVALELLLYFGWQGYLAIRAAARFNRLGVARTRDHAPQLVRKAAKAAQRYRTNLSAQHMRDAVSYYWQARGFESRVRYQSNTRMMISGFCAKGTRAEVISTLQAKASLAGLDVRLHKNVFRPDVPYRFEGDWGLFSGIEVEVLIDREQDSEALGSFLEAITREIPLEIESDILHISGISEFSNSAIANMNDILPIIEAVGDRKTASSLVPRIVKLIKGNIDSWGELALVKLWLVSGLPLPKVLGDLGWIDAKRLSPDWGPVKPAQSQSNDGLNQKLNTPVPDFVSVVPGVRLTVVEQARVFKGDTVLIPDGLLDIDPAANPSFDFVAGRWDHVVGTHLDFGRAAVKVPTKSAPALKEAILLASRSDSNWFHWLIETLPKFQYLDAGVSKDVPVLLSKRIPESAKESIRLLTERELVYLDEEQVVSVGRLHVSSPVLFHPDTPELWLKPGTDAIDYKGLLGLRAEILGKSKGALSESSSPHSIYLPRSSGARSILNSTQLARVLKKFGFSVLDPGQMSFMGQVVAFHSARRIVLVGGASMANLIFCSEGTSVVTLGSKSTAGYSMPRILAGVAGAQVLSVSGKPRGVALRGSFLSRVHAHYSIDIRKLTRALRRAV
jgi:hypothetical protein